MFESSAPEKISAKIYFVPSERENTQENLARQEKFSTMSSVEPQDLFTQEGPRFENNEAEHQHFFDAMAAEETASDEVVQMLELLEGDEDDDLQLKPKAKSGTIGMNTLLKKPMEYTKNLVKKGAANVAKNDKQESTLPKKPLTVLQQVHRETFGKGGRNLDEAKISVNDLKVAGVEYPKLIREKDTTNIISINIIKRGKDLKTDEPRAIIRSFIKALNYDLTGFYLMTQARTRIATVEAMNEEQFEEEFEPRVKGSQIRMKATIYTDMMTFGKMKNHIKGWLVQEKIWIERNELGTSQTFTLGYISNVRAESVSLSRIEKEVTSKFSAPVPIQAHRHRITVKTQKGERIGVWVKITCRYTDINLATEGMLEAAASPNFPGKWIPVAVTRNTKNMMELLENHQQYMLITRSVPIFGVKLEHWETQLPEGDNLFTRLNALEDANGKKVVISVDTCADTEKLGKLIVTIHVWGFEALNAWIKSELTKTLKHQQWISFMEFQEPRTTFRKLTNDNLQYSMALMQNIRIHSNNIETNIQKEQKTTRTKAPVLPKVPVVEKAHTTNLSEVQEKRVRYIEKSQREVESRLKQLEKAMAESKQEFRSFTESISEQQKQFSDALLKIQREMRESMKTMMEQFSEAITKFGEQMIQVTEQLNQVQIEQQITRNEVANAQLEVEKKRKKKSRKRSTVTSLNTKPIQKI